MSITVQLKRAVPYYFAELVGLSSGLANDWFNDYFGVSEPGLRQNDFGGTFGGPVRIPGLYNGKDKTFFFRFGTVGCD